MPSSAVVLSVTIDAILESPECDKCDWWPGGPAGELQRSPRPLAAIGGRVLLLSEREDEG